MPDAHKVAKLKPIYNKGENNRPFRLQTYFFTFFTKVIQRIVYDQTNTFHLENNILYLCLAHLTDKIVKGFVDGLLTGMIIIDHLKGFDTIKQEVLLQKLKAIRFSEQSI